MRVKIVNIFKDIKLKNFNSIETFFFDLQKFDVSFITWPDSLKIVLSGGMRHLKK